MRENAVKQKLVAGGLAYGTFLFEFNTTGIARIVADAGAEFGVFDMEHTGWSIESVRQLMATAQIDGFEPIVRVPDTEYHFIARALDMGARGIMVPMVESAEEAQKIVASAKYPPVGRRGSAFGIAHDGYTGGSAKDKQAHANSETLLIAQIETRTGLENVESIAAVEGIDVLWVGQSDLTSSLGILAEFDHPDYLAALDRVAAAARQHGKTAGFMAMSPDEAEMVAGRGFRCLAYSGDLWVYKQALKSGLAEFRQRTQK